MAFQDTNGNSMIHKRLDIDEFEKQELLFLQEVMRILGPYDRSDGRCPDCLASRCVCDEWIDDTSYFDSYEEGYYEEGYYEDPYDSEIEDQKKDIKEAERYLKEH
jgi:hypothetical protein